MTAEEFVELIADRPFQPLRLHLADGRVREIRHREMAIVSKTSVAIGVPSDDLPRIAVKIVHCSLANIVEIEPIVPGT